MSNSQQCINAKTPNQWIGYKIATASSGMLSACGSLATIFMILRSRSVLSSLKNRLLFAMCIFDIIGSIGWGLSTAPIPRGSACTYGAIGNQATCVSQGTMFTLGLSVPLYNAMLCIFFMRVIISNVKDEVLESYEWLMHGLSISPTLMVALIAASNNLFNNYTIGCWLVESDQYGKSFDGPGTLLTVLIIIILVIALVVISIITFSLRRIYKFVKDKEQRMLKYRFPRTPSAATGSRRRNSQAASQLSETVQDTKIQAYLYVFSFVLTYVPTTAILLLDLFHLDCPFPVMLLQGILSPLQGFWNFLVYVRPRLKAASKRYPNTTFPFRLYKTIFASNKDNTPTASTRRPLSRSVLSASSNFGTPTMFLSRFQSSDRSSHRKGNRDNKNNDSITNSDGKNIRDGDKRPLFPREPELCLRRGDTYYPEDIPVVSSPKQDSKDCKFDALGGGPLASIPDKYDDFEDELGDDPIDMVNFEGGSGVLDRNFCESVSISLLLAEDILPPSRLRNKGPKHRMSLVDRFPLGFEETIDDEEESSPSLLMTAKPQDAPFEIDGVQEDYSCESFHPFLGKKQFKFFSKDSSSDKKKKIFQNDGKRPCRRHSCPNLVIAGGVD